MKISRRVIYWITAFVLVFITFWFGYVHKSAEEIPPEKPVPVEVEIVSTCLLYTSPSPRDQRGSRMPSSA